MGTLRRDIGPDTIHLCIDMQRLFSANGPWPTPWMERVMPMVVSLVSTKPERTLFTRFVTPRSIDGAFGMWRAYYTKWSAALQDQIDPALLELMPELQRYVPPATVVDKMVYSAFADGTLHPWLRERNVDTLIVTGSETDVSVLSSVLAAIDHGYRVIIANDAVCSSADETHDALIGLYSRRFDIQIELSDTSQILDAWTTTS